MLAELGPEQTFRPDEAVVVGDAELDKLIDIVRAVRGQREPTMQVGTLYFSALLDEVLAARRARRR